MQVFLINPRGFCAGVKRAVEIVDGAVEKYRNKGIYVNHEIVHNKYVVDYFVQKGVKFGVDINQIPTDSVIIFSAHGVSEDIEKLALEKNLHIIDATCPLVKKIHRIAKKYDEESKQIILIGHKNHPEVIGTIGRVNSNVIIIENEEDINKIETNNPQNLVYITQTTLSIDDTFKIITKLKEKFPEIKSQDNSDICYATQNRQNAVKDAIDNIGHLDLLLVIGSIRSSNSNRLRDIGVVNRIESYLIDSEDDLSVDLLKNKKRIAITAGASAPEILVKKILHYLVANFKASVLEVDGVMENIEFHAPKDVRIGISDLY